MLFCIHVFRNDFYQLFYGVFDDQFAAMKAILNGKESFALQVILFSLSLSLSLSLSQSLCISLFIYLSVSMYASISSLEENFIFLYIFYIKTMNNLFRLEYVG